MNTISAASQLGGDVTVLLAGGDVASAATEVAAVKGVSKVLTAQKDIYVGLLPGKGASKV